MMPNRLLIGRSVSADLRLEDGAVSGEHAVINWDGGSWRLRDLGSRNGTFLNDRRLAPGQSATLAEGDRVSLRRRDISWKVEEISQPNAFARRTHDGHVQLTEHGMLCLPSTDAPAATIFEDGSGSWVVEQDGVVTTARDNQQIDVAGSAWVLSLPQGIGPTAALSSSSFLMLEDASLAFRVSRDEELVDVELVLGEERHHLESRAHHYMLLTLARQRQHDVELAPNERGWVYRQDLERMLKFDATHLNVQVYRARKQLHGAGLNDAVRVVERRSGRLRLGISRFTIEAM